MAQKMKKDNDAIHFQCKAQSLYIIQFKDIIQSNDISMYIKYMRNQPDF